MTIRQLYQLAKIRFRAVKLDSPETDAILLIERFTGFTRSDCIIKGDTPCPSDCENEFLLAVEQRCARVPLQYITGVWSFMGMPLHVGKGVLIPRDDTEVLVRAVASRLCTQDALCGLDLCAGSGAVSLGICSLLPNAQLIAIELSEDAMRYLYLNTADYPRIQVCKGDVLSSTWIDAVGLPTVDFIASNPPYVTPQEWEILSPEVKAEPESALIGGEDGLRFYRAISRLWLPFLKPGGLLAVEIGETQGELVSSIFLQAGLTDVTVEYDLANSPRVVCGRTPLSFASRI